MGQALERVDCEIRASEQRMQAGSERLDGDMRNMEDRLGQRILHERGVSKDSMLALGEQVRQMQLCHEDLDTRLQRLVAQTARGLEQQLLSQAQDSLEVVLQGFERRLCSSERRLGAAEESQRVCQNWYTEHEEQWTAQARQLAVYDEALQRLTEQFKEIPERLELKLEGVRAAA